MLQACFNSLWPNVKWTLLWVNMAEYRNCQTTSLEGSNTDSKQNLLTI